MSGAIGRSESLFRAAEAVLAGGVNSPVRSFGTVGGTPRFMRAGRGSRIFDEDGREYIDYVQSWGANILGHAAPQVVQAVQEAVRDGFSFGAPTEAETRLAEAARHRMPSLERLRFVSSGTEATMSALRVARAATGRNGFLKFAGAYHGHADPFLARAGSGLAGESSPAVAGVPDDVVRHARTVAFNDLAAVEAILAREAREIAAVIVEPVAANMGVVAPRPGFLEGLREACDRHDVLLIFDEVITGFRIGHGGAQERYGVRPDLTCLGKVLGGGLPLAAYGGREDLMRLVAPLGPVYQAGTLSGNPACVAAGLATLGSLTPSSYETLEVRGAEVEAALADAMGPAVAVNRVGSLLGAFFRSAPVWDFEAARASDVKSYCAFFHALLANGVYLPPSPFEAFFVSLAHTSRDVAETASALRAFADRVEAPIP